MDEDLEHRQQRAHDGVENGKDDQIGQGLSRMLVFGPSKRQGGTEQETA
jgi:hypothetical protein